MQTIARNPEDLVEVRFVAPAAKAAELQTIIGEILSRPAPADQWEPPFDSSHGPKDAWDMPGWEDDGYDRSAMHWIVKVLRPEHVNLLLHIHANPGATPTRALIAAVGYDEGIEPSGVFRAIGGRFRRCNRRPVWTGGEKTPQGQLVGWTSNAVATQLFLAAVADHYPDKVTGGS